MKNRYSNWIILGLALVAPVSAAADSHPSQWVGVWELTQHTDSGPVTLRLQVPAEGKPLLFGSVWEGLALTEASFQTDSMMLNWQTQGVNMVFRGQRSGDRVRGNWELVHPQYRTTNTFTGKRLIDRPQWKLLQGLEGKPVPLFLDLNAQLVDHESELRDYWKGSFYPDYLPLLNDPPPVMRLAANLLDSRFREKSQEFARIVGDMVERVEKKLPGATLPYRFVALPFGPKQPQPVFVSGRTFLVANAAALFDASQPDPNVIIPLALLRSSFERFLFTVRLPSADTFRLGMPLYLFSQLYPETVHRALGLSADQLAELEAELDSSKKRALSGTKLSPGEGRVLAYHFVRQLASSRTAQELLDLTTATIEKEYKAFLDTSDGS